MRITDHIRKSLESKIRPDPRPRPPLQELRADQWSPKFEQYMRNRLIVGACRYETFDEKRQHNTYDCIGYIRSKCDEYEATGNQECLVDLANLAMIEFECPTHPNPHFSPADDKSHVKKLQ